MIHSAGPTVPPVVITIFSWKFFCEILKTTCEKIVITTGRYCESASWINFINLRINVISSEELILLSFLELRRSVA